MLQYFHFPHNSFVYKFYYRQIFLFSFFKGINAINCKIFSSLPYKVEWRLSWGWHKTWCDVSNNLKGKKEKGLKNKYSPGCFSVHLKCTIPRQIMSSNGDHLNTIWENFWDGTANKLAVLWRQLESSHILRVTRSHPVRLLWFCLLILKLNCRKNLNHN